MQPSHNTYVGTACVLDLKIQGGAHPWPLSSFQSSGEQRNVQVGHHVE